MSDWNLMPGSGWILARQERAMDAYDTALGQAWEALYEQAPEGVGWEIAEEDQDEHARFVFTFRDAGGYEFTAYINPWDDQDYEPPY